MALSKERTLGRLQSEHGMTLIEIMIVMVIVAGLMAVIGSTVFGALDRANVKNTRLAMAEISKAIELYSADCKGIPSTDQGLTALTEAPASGCNNWGPTPYLKKNMLKDAWGGDFIYEATGSTYRITSLGKDRRDGGEGVNKDLHSDDPE